MFLETVPSNIRRDIVEANKLAHVVKQYCQFSSINNHLIQQKHVSIRIAGWSSELYIYLGKPRERLIVTLPVKFYRKLSAGSLSMILLWTG